VLLTGFEPFDGQSVNASWLAVQAAEAAWLEAGQGDDELVTACLPVSFARAPDELRALWAATRPDVVICVGEAGGRARVGIEQVAVNRAAGAIPDNDGARPTDVPVVEGAPGSYATGLPSVACLEGVRAAGVPVELSGSAGTFVCNATFFAARHHAATATDERARVGFVHVPRTPAQVQDGGDALPVEASARALTALLRVLLAPT
jgi:pyroglutamyl-peptidase